MMNVKIILEDLLVQKKKLEKLIELDSLPVIIENQNVIIEEIEKRLNEVQSAEDKEK